MKILLVSPRSPDTFWGFKHALAFVSKKASLPPLGLLTVAAMLPREWDMKLVDMNVSTLTDKDIQWADYVFVSAMTVHRTSVIDVIARCNKLGIKVVAGGPLFTSAHEEFSGVDHFLLGEAEVTMPLFLSDLASGAAKPLYVADQKADISQTPLPMWSLLNMKHYSSMSVQYSRGCPFDCDFCNVTVLYGHNPRTKGKAQMINELDVLFRYGWRGAVFMVDDNFVGNKKKLKGEILPAVIEWSKEKKNAFNFNTQASINLADDEEMMSLMRDANFDRVFIGIETIDENSLAECKKHQNQSRDMVDSVQKIQRHGMEVQGGFIVGFDSDDPGSIFRNQINFIQKSGIVTAMVGVLNAPIGTHLYQRMKQEHRLLSDMSGDNTDGSTNIVPKMNRDTLIKGYRSIIDNIYSPKQYYERVTTFLREYRPKNHLGFSHFQFCHLTAAIKATWFIGIKEKGRRYYWKLIFETLLKRPRAIPESVTLSIYGFHFRHISRKLVSMPAHSSA